MPARILAPLAYLLGGPTYLVALPDGRVVARIIWPDDSDMTPMPTDLDEPIGRLVGDEDLLPDDPRASKGVYNILGPMGLGVIQYQCEHHEGRRVWSRVGAWPGRTT